MSVRSKGRGFGVLLASLLVLVALPALVAGRQMESVGAVLVPENLSAAGLQQARNAAFEQAVLDAVLHVAENLVRADRAARLPGPPLGEPGTPDVEEETPEALHTTLRKLLGHRPKRYTNRFELEEDRGAQERMFVQEGNPNLHSEYVVMARVEVDVAAVRQKLEEAGLIAARVVVALETLEQIRVVLVDLPNYSTYAQVVASLREQAGVRSVAPLLFERGRSVLGVESDLAPQALAHALEMGLPGSILVERLAIEGRQIELWVRLAPATGPEESGEVVGSSPPRPLIR